MENKVLSTLCLDIPRMGPGQSGPSWSQAHLSSSLGEAEKSKQALSLRVRQHLPGSARILLMPPGPWPCPATRELRTLVIGCATGQDQLPLHRTDGHSDPTGRGDNGFWRPASPLHSLRLWSPPPSSLYPLPDTHPMLLTIFLQAPLGF